MNYRKIILLGFLPLLLAGKAWAILPNEIAAGNAMLKKSFEIQQAFIERVISSGNIWHMKYTMTVLAMNPQKNAYETVNTEGEMLAGKKLRINKTKQTEAYEDDKDVFTVWKSRKMVMRTPGNAKRLEENEVYQSIVRDSFLLHYRMVSAVRCGGADTGCMKYVLLPNANFTSPYSQLTMYCNTAKASIYRIDMEVNSQHSRHIKSYSMMIKELGQMKANPDWMPIRNLFLDAAGKLKAPYIGYTYQEYKKENKKESKKINKHIK